MSPMASQCSAIFAVVDTEETEERRWLTAKHPLRRGEHEVSFRDGLHLLVMIPRYLVGAILRISFQLETFPNASS